MNQDKPTRRSVLTGLAALTGAAMLPLAASATTKLEASPIKKEKTFTYCLNTSTIMGQKQGIVKDIQTAAKAGYDGVEIWINALQKYLDEGGSLRELKTMIDDLGIKVENAIGFAPWIVDDSEKRQAALEQAKKEIGGIIEG